MRTITKKNITNNEYNNIKKTKEKIANFRDLDETHIGNRHT